MDFYKKELRNFFKALSEEFAWRWPEIETIKHGFREKIGADGERTANIDYACEQIILHQLNKLEFPWIAFSEEIGMFSSEHNNKLRNIVFLIDPLDATHNFLIGFPFFSISISVFIDGEISHGWVYDPIRRITYLGISHEGSFLINEKGQCRRLTTNNTRKLNQSIIGLIRPKDDSEYSKYKDLFLHSNKIRCLSCSSLEIIYIAVGIYDGFVDLSTEGWQKQCDIEASLLILREAGGIAVDKNGRPYKSSVPTLDSLKKRVNIVAGSNDTIVNEILKSTEKEEKYNARY
ncbi:MULTISPECIES: inositol monophosphatase family protein [Bacillus]|uniref:inositol monophosphatase family protein n=1 Tax=Bacillus TaxID=1386 RepID=UPI00028E9BB0|nr:MULTISPECIES: inositol monophosphatase [Bacillus]EKF36476.1 inositol monophosphatase [Bacillus xiamenensis]MBD3861248.1 inositol monophosphatase [Bacillus sp. 28A-2]MCW1837944.1 inositol monophosphatase [Bacillus xiamenensis]